MIISHEHRFIFIKTRKTAGTSIEAYLSAFCGDKDVLTPLRPPVACHDPRNYKGLFNPFRELTHPGDHGRSAIFKDFVKRRRFRNHMLGLQIRARVPAEVWENYYKFCVERNPWDKTLSHYHHLRSKVEDLCSLDEYFAAGFKCSNYPFYTDRNGEIIVDRILRYEDLDEELSEVLGMLDIPFDGKLSVRAKGRYREDRRPYQEVLSDAQRRLVERMYRQEIELMGYEF
jgi:hypothetical protein